MTTQEQNVRKFVQCVIDAAFDDHYQKRLYMTGGKLRTRLALDKSRIAPRKGDDAWAREIYHATRKLMETETENDYDE